MTLPPRRDIDELLDLIRAGHAPERRAHPRVAARIAAEIVTERGRVPATGVDLSVGGVRLHAAGLPAASRLRLRMRLDPRDAWRELEGEVAWREHGADPERMGIAFTHHPGNGAHQAIQDFLARHPPGSRAGG